MAENKNWKKKMKKKNEKSKLDLKEYSFSGNMENFRNLVPGGIQVSQKPSFFFFFFFFFNAKLHGRSCSSWVGQ